MKVSLLIQLAGLLCFVGGISWFSIPLGIAVLGGAIFITGIALEKDGK